jgi:hypothetical protein
MLTLLEKAQLYWFSRFLSSHVEPPAPYAASFFVDFEVFTWALPKTEWDSYPNLATCTFPS